MFEYDVQVPLDVEDLSPPQDRGTVTVYDVAFASPRGGRVSAFLVVPCEPADNALAGLLFPRDDYRQAGLNYFPINLEVRDSVKLLFVFSLVLYAASIALYFVGDYAWLYLVMANILGIGMVYAGFRLVRSHDSSDAWRLYRLSSFPYLGVLFLVMCLDIIIIA